MNPAALALRRWGDRLLRIRATIFAAMALVTHASAAPEGMTFDIREFGAVGDGKTLNAEAFRRAIAAATAHPGHDTVLVPSGTFLSGVIELRSDLTLRLAKEAVLLGSKTLADYDLPPRAGEKPRNWLRALIVGDGVSGVTICGEGTIDGNRVRDPKGEEGQRGPHTARFAKAEHVTVRDIRIVDSGNYAILLHDSKHCRFENLHIEGGWDAIHCSLREGNSLENFTARHIRAEGIYGPACSVESWGEPIRAPGIGFSIVEPHGSRDVKQVDE